MWRGLQDDGGGNTKRGAGWVGEWVGWGEDKGARRGLDTKYGAIGQKDGRPAKGRERMTPKYERRCDTLGQDKR